MTEAMQSDIEQVIARSRQPGGFSERKRFTVARQRAIQKMREFALFDPYHYVLELIQAAVANQATHVDLQISAREFVLSYVGGGFAEIELAQLFDYLFTSKQDVAHSDLRQLAVGVNALMFFEPELIIIESGQGTLETTTRIEIRQKDDTVDVGKPEQPLRGTFVRAQGLKRLKAWGKSELDTIGGELPEAQAITNRCLCAPIPIILNHQPIFGYSSQRIPVLYGYDNVVSFDEGDLYGAIGLARHEHNSFFKLLTWGTWVQSVAHQFSGQAAMGGVVSFDRLQKTADHAAIVRDERLEELWARLAPYAEMSRLGSGAGAALQLRPLGGPQLSIAEVRQVIEAHENVVVVSTHLDEKSVGWWRARQIGQLLGAPVLMGRDKDIELLARMMGATGRVLRPDLEDDASLEFFAQPPAEPPPRPWLAAPHEVESVALSDLINTMSAAGSIDAWQNFRPFWDRLTNAGSSERSTCRATIFAPQAISAVEASSGAQGLFVRVKSVGRVVWQGQIASPFPGFWLDIEVGVSAPNVLLECADRVRDKSAAECIAEAMANGCNGDFKKITQQILQSVAREHFTPQAPAAHAARAALARDTILRLRPAPAGERAAGIEFALLGTQQRKDLLELALFTTLDGRALSLRDLEALMRETGGLLYGVIPEVEADLEGLDRAKILALDADSETLLIQIVGHGAYVRVDERDILARTHKSRWQVRDLALGLRDYPDCDLLVEGPGAAGGEAPDEDDVQTLVQALCAKFAEAHARVSTAQLNHWKLHEDVIEAGRQAARHLRYFVCRRLARRLQPDGLTLPTYGVEDLGLFVDAGARMVSLRRIIDEFDQNGQLVMLDGRASDIIHFDEALSADSAMQPLMVNPWSFYLLRAFGQLVGALDFEVSLQAEDVAGTDVSRYIVHQQVQAPGVRGEVGFPRVAPAHPEIAVVSHDRQQVYALRGLGSPYGVVGTLLLEGDPGMSAAPGAARDVDWARISELAEAAALRVVEQLLERLMELPAGQVHERALGALLALARRDVQLVRDPAGALTYRIVAAHEPVRALVEKILRAPLFPTLRGVPVGAARLIEQFCVEQSRGEVIDAAWRLEPAPDTPPVLTTWLASMTDPARVIALAPTAHMRAWPHGMMAASARALHLPAQSGAAGEAVGAEPADAFTTRVERLLHALRPDRPGDLARPDNPGGNPTNWVRVALAEPAEFEQLARRGGRDGEGESAAALVYQAGVSPVVWLNRQHWLVARAVDAPADNPQPLAWLLLAIYGHINALLEPVTNEHELQFQRNLAQALQAGELV